MDHRGGELASVTRESLGPSGIIVSGKLGDADVLVSLGVFGLVSR